MIEFSLQCAGIAIPVLIAGWLVVILANLPLKGRLDLKNAGPVTRAGMLITLIGVIGTVISILGVIASGVFWLWSEFTRDLTPSRLALYSIILAPSPLLLSALGVILARLAGGQVDARGARDCRIAGIELGGLIYSLFMSYFLTLFSAGLAFFGLLISGIWALI